MRNILSKMAANEVHKLIKETTLPLSDTESILHNQVEALVELYDTIDERNVLSKEDIEMLKGVISISFDLLEKAESKTSKVRDTLSHCNDWLIAIKE